MYTSEADVYKPGIYGGSVRVWATAWDVFRRPLSRVRRGGRAAVDFVVCPGCGVFFSFFFSFLFLRMHTAYCKYEATLPHVPLY